MTGYQGPSPTYAEQLIAFTAAMVGNYGVDDSRLESERPHARCGADAATRRPGVGGLARGARAGRTGRRRHAR